jgi:LL-diaminopimelate aminotransferase
MEIRASRKIQSLPTYAFAALDAKVTELTQAGAALIDFGVGDPLDPTPEHVRRACQEAIDVHAAAGYPSYAGAPVFRQGVAKWMRGRYEVDLDPETEICATIGSKEAIFNFPQAVLDPGDVVLAPNPGYPPYSRGTLFAGGRTVFLDLREERGFLPDLGAVGEQDLSRARILWVNSPHNPTGAVADRGFWEACIRFCQEHGIILACDESYGEIYFTDPPVTPLELAREGVICFYSMSKRNCMTGYRVGWVAGDARLISLVKKLKTNIDSGCPNFIQAAALAALADEEHVRELRRRYRERRDIMLRAFRALGWRVLPPAGTFYIWQPVPPGFTAESFCERLLEPDLAIVAMPGTSLAEPHDGANPGEGYVRFALIPPIERCREAARRLVRAFPCS